MGITYRKQQIQRLKAVFWDEYPSWTLNTVFGYWLINSDVCDAICCLVSWDQLEPGTESLVKLLQISVKYPFFAPCDAFVLLNKQSPTLCERQKLNTNVGTNFTRQPLSRQKWRFMHHSKGAWSREFSSGLAFAKMTARGSAFLSFLNVTPMHYW